MKVMVTGATGFIGNNLVRELLTDGEEVRALVRPGADASSLSKLRVQVVKGDLLDKDSLIAGLHGSEVLFHMAALYRLWAPSPRAFREVNVQGTRNILDAAFHVGVKRIVYTSTAAVFGHWKGGLLPNEETMVNPEELVDGYHRSKLLAEKEALAYAAQGLPVVVVNPTTPVGPWDNKPTPTGKIVLGFLKGKMPAYIDTGLNLVHVRDVVRGHILALEKGRIGERYILGGTNLTLKELFQKLAVVSGRPAPSLKMPYWMALGIAYLEHWASVVPFKREPRVPLAGVHMARHPMYYDCGKAIRELEMPQTPIEEALKESVDWFREHFHLEAAA